MKVLRIGNLQMLPFCNINISLGHYQNNFKIYLDEFPEQEELRKEYFNNNYIDEKGNKFTRSFIINKNFIQSNQIDNYFENRWLRRN